MALQYITEQGYKDYFGVTETPADIERKETLSVSLFNSMSSFILTPTNFVNPDIINDFCKDKIEKAIYEQIKFFDDNSNVFKGNDNTISSFKIDDFSESYNGNKNIDSSNRISPNSYTLLNECGFFYGGVLAKKSCRFFNNV